MPNASNAKIEWEASQAELLNQELTDTGDQILYTFGHNLLSAKEGFEADVRPDGITVGFNLLSPTTTNNQLSHKAFKFSIGGTEYTKTAGTVTLTRDAIAYQKHSIIVDAAGTVSAVNADGDAAGFDTVRGADGGPPTLPIDKVEIGQVWLNNVTPAVIASTEIKQSASADQVEMSDVPGYRVNNIGEGNKATVSDQEYAFLKFDRALEVSHGAAVNAAATVPRSVYADYSVPTLVTLSDTVDYKPAESAPSTSSEQIYEDKTIGSVSYSLGAGSFKVFLKNGITDAIVKEAKKNLLFKFFPNQNKVEHNITQGYIGLARTFAVDANISADVTIASQYESVDFDS